MKKIFTISISIFCAVFLFSAFKLIDYYKGSYSSEKKYDELQSLIKDDLNIEYNEEPMTFSEKYEELLNRNNDMAAWISIEGTNVNYPVMQTPEYEEYYLRKDFDKAYALRGSLFLNGDATFDSINMTIYGHNMDDGTMFGALRSYTDKSFYEEHKYIKLESKAGTRFYQIAFVFKTVDIIGHQNFISYYNFKNPNKDEFNQQIKLYEKAALYDTFVEVEYGSQLLTLSTCEYSQKQGRLVIVAKLVYEE